MFEMKIKVKIVYILLLFLPLFLEENVFTTYIHFVHANGSLTRRYRYVEPRIRRCNYCSPLNIEVTVFDCTLMFWNFLWGQSGTSLLPLIGQFWKIINFQPIRNLICFNLSAKILIWWHDLINVKTRADPWSSG